MFAHHLVEYFNLKIMLTNRQANTILLVSVIVSIIALIFLLNIFYENN